MFISSSQVEAALNKHEYELKAAQSDQDAMRQKLAALEKKIIVGGENLLEKAEEQVNKHLLHLHEGN